MTSQLQSYEDTGHVIEEVRSAVDEIARIARPVYESEISKHPKYVPPADGHSKEV